MSRGIKLRSTWTVFAKTCLPPQTSLPAHPTAPPPRPGPSPPPFPPPSSDLRFCHCGKTFFSPTQWAQRNWCSFQL